jgi:hypothetical protein
LIDEEQRLLKEKASLEYSQAEEEKIKKNELERLRLESEKRKLEDEEQSKKLEYERLRMIEEKVFLHFFTFYNSLA